jgi:hypothetical protein
MSSEDIDAAQDLEHERLRRLVGRPVEDPLLR